MLTLMDRLFSHSVPVARRVSLRARFDSAMALHRSRRRLGMLEPHQLADIGLTHETAAIEANRSVWDAPDTWKS